MKSLQKIDSDKFPFNWVDLSYFPDSKGEKKEIYLRTYDGGDILTELILLFYTLFSEVKDGVKIYDNSWWDYCIDMWNPETDQYDYRPDGKSEETKAYLSLLKDSGIDIGYSGSCMCLDWDHFLPISLKCVVSHKAPYSSIFYDSINDFFFYFHHTGSIGLYYRKQTDTIRQILAKAEYDYDIR